MLDCHSALSLACDMSLCFWCGTEQPPNPKADLVVEGSNNPRYSPCLGCEATMGKGVTVVEISDEEAVKFQVGMHLGEGRVVYPTGLWAVIDQDVVREFQTELSDMTGRYGFCMCSSQIWDLMELPR